MYVVSLSGSFIDNKHIKCSGCRKWNFRFLNFKHFTRVYTLNSLVVQSLWKTLSRMLICSLSLVLFMFKRSNSALVFRTYKLLLYWIPHACSCGFSLLFRLCRNQNFLMCSCYQEYNCQWKLSMLSFCTFLYEIIYDACKCAKLGR
jgi:hypothetical protein